MTIKLGIIGMSDGNGHPYSWSAICNGYNHDIMQACPFPTIPNYLNKRIFPRDAISELQVTHIWTQNSDISEHIAKASNIKYVVNEFTDMLGKVDGLLLARDDAENHYQFAKPFLIAGVPIYIDKPIATTLPKAQALYDLEKYEGQIFTCTALRYAKELLLTKEQLAALGVVKYIIAYTPKKWETYAIHIIEPIIANFGEQGEIREHHICMVNDVTTVMVKWQTGLQATLVALGSNKSPVKICVFGTEGNIELIFEDSFSCFKSALQNFSYSIQHQNRMIPLAETLATVKVIEIGT
jgi:predicted dehydrogenase